MSKSEKQVDKVLNDIVKENEKEQTKMKFNKEATKTWVIVVLVGVIISAGVYLFAYKNGYNAKVAETNRINTLVSQQVNQLKHQ